MSFASQEEYFVEESSDEPSASVSSDVHPVSASPNNPSDVNNARLTTSNSSDGIEACTPIKRRDFSVSEKVELLIKYDALPKMSQSKAARELGISKQLVCRLLQQRADIMQAWLHNKDTNRKRKRCGKDGEVESALKEWFDRACAEGVTVTGPIMRKKAEELAKQLGKEDFVATDGWFSRWRKRENVMLLGRPRGGETVSEPQASQWPEMLATYSAECVYGAVTRDQEVDDPSHAASTTGMDLNSVTHTLTTPVRAIMQHCPSKRRDLSISEKLELLAKYDVLPQMSQSQAASQLGVSQPLLCKILKTRHEIEQESSQNSSRKRKRCGKDGEVEAALKEWFDKAQKEGASLTGPMMRKKAEELARELGKEDFVATDGWFSRWRKRENITTGRTRALSESSQSQGPTDDNFLPVENDESSFVNDSNPLVLKADTNTPLVEVSPQKPVFPVDSVYLNNPDLDVKPVITSTTSEEHCPQWFLNPENETTGLLSAYPPNSVYSTEILRISYLGKPSFYEEKNCNLPKERLSVLCCFNLCGLKQKLLVVGQRDNRAYFRHVRQLPIDYYFNDEARVTPHIIFDWLIKWDRDLDREIVLMIDDCQDLRSITSFQNLKFIPVPEVLRSCGTTVSQALYLRFAELKRRRREWLRCGPDDDESFPSAVSDSISLSTSFLDLLHMVAQSWEKVPSSSIAARFEQCGLLANTDWTSSSKRLPTESNTASHIKMEMCNSETTVDLVVDQYNAPPPTNEEVKKALSVLTRFVYHRSEDFNLHYQYENHIQSLE